MKEFVKVEIKRFPEDERVITFELPLVEGKTPFESAITGLNAMYSEMTKGDKKKDV